MTETAKADQQAKPTGLALMRAEFPAFLDEEHGDDDGADWRQQEENQREEQEVGHVD